MIDGVMYIRRVSSHFNLDQFGLMGHSMGAGMATLFAASYPDMVTQLICIDFVHAFTREPEDWPSKTRESVETLLAFEKKTASRNPPEYTYEEAKARVMEGTQRLFGRNVITEDSADILLKRGLEPIGENFTFSRDLRRQIVTSSSGFTMEVIKSFAKSISGPHLVVRAANEGKYDPKPAELEAVELLKVSNPKFELQIVPGTHHVHLNEPEKVNAKIIQFLKEKSKV